MTHTTIRRHRRKGRSVRRHARKVEPGNRPPLKFFDLRARRSFTSTNYKIVKRGKRTFAEAISPKGGRSFRIVSSKK